MQECQTLQTNLDSSTQHFMQDVRSILHEPHVCWAGVLALAVGDRINETVFEFLQRSEEIRLDEADHGVICKTHGVVCTGL